MFLRPTELIEELRIKKYILPGMKGADFGCGGGYFTSFLANEVGPEGIIYALDIQEDVLKEAQEFLKNLNLRNVKFLKQDLEKNSGLGADSLDFVFISQVLYQAEKPENILQEAKRVLKNGGHLILVEPEEKNYLFWGQKVYSLEELISFLENQNFKIIEIKTINGYYLIVGQK